MSFFRKMFKNEKRVVKDISRCESFAQTSDEGKTFSNDTQKAPSFSSRTLVCFITQKITIESRKGHSKGFLSFFVPSTLSLHAHRQH